MLYIVPKIFYRANLKSKAMAASIYGHNLAVNLHRLELENCFYVYQLHRFVSFFCFAHKLQNANWFHFNFSSEDEHVLALFLFFGQIEPRCSYKVSSYIEKEVHSFHYMC